MSIDLTDLYRDLHRHPELAFAETRTAAIVADHLRSLGLDVTTGVGGTGVVGVLANGVGPRVYLRADMDGLPVHEQTGLDYASTDSGVGAGGDLVPVMHACGHDMHVTWLVGAVEGLAGSTSSWSGTLVAVFQPAEETIAGAQAMVDDDLIGRFGRPDVVLGQHLAPLPAGFVALTEGAAMAGVDNLAVTLHGSGGHGSRPHSTIDPVVAAAATVLRLQTVVAREVEPTQLAVVTVGTLHAGTKSNIIPSEARLGMSIRTVDPGVRNRVLAAVTRIIEGEAAASGMSRPPTIVSEDSAPPTMNDIAATQRVRGAFVRHLGAETMIDIGTASGSEDVGIIAVSAGAPLVFWFVGGSDPVVFATAQANGTADQDVPGNHSPLFAPVLDPTIGAGVRTLVVAARVWLARPL